MSAKYPTTREIEDYQRTAPGARESELMERTPGETKTFHSDYLGHRIYKVVDAQGRTGYEIHPPAGAHWTEDTLRMAKITIKYS